MESAELAAARKRITVLENELAVTRQAYELMKEQTRAIIRGSISEHGNGSKGNPDTQFPSRQQQPQT